MPDERTSCALCGVTFNPPTRIRATDEVAQDDDPNERHLYVIDRDSEEAQEIDSENPGGLLDGNIIPSKALQWLMKGRVLTSIAPIVSHNDHTMPCNLTSQRYGLSDREPFMGNHVFVSSGTHTLEEEVDLKYSFDEPEPCLGNTNDPSQSDTNPLSQPTDSKLQTSHSSMDLQCYGGEAIPLHEACCNILQSILFTKGFQNDWTGTVRLKVCFDFFNGRINDVGNGCEMEYGYEWDEVWTGEDTWHVWEDQEYLLNSPFYNASGIRAALFELWSGSHIDPSSLTRSDLKKDGNRKSLLENLPSEILSHIMTYMSKSSFANFRLSSRHLGSVMVTQEFWRAQFRNEFPYLWRAGALYNCKQTDWRQVYFNTKDFWGSLKVSGVDSSASLGLRNGHRIHRIAHNVSIDLWQQELAIRREEVLIGSRSFNTIPAGRQWQKWQDISVKNYFNRQCVCERISIFYSITTMEGFDSMLNVHGIKFDYDDESDQLFGSHHDNELSDHVSLQQNMLGLALNFNKSGYLCGLKVIMEHNLSPILGLTKGSWYIMKPLVGNTWVGMSYLEDQLGIHMISLLEIGNEDQMVPQEQSIVWCPEIPTLSNYKLKLNLGYSDPSYHQPINFVLFEPHDPVTKVKSITGKQVSKQVQNPARGLCDLIFVFSSGKELALRSNSESYTEELPGPEFVLKAGEKLTGCNLLYNHEKTRYNAQERNDKKTRLIGFLDLYLTTNLGRSFGRFGSRYYDNGVSVVFSSPSLQGFLTDCKSSGNFDRFGIFTQSEEEANVSTIDHFKDFHGFLWAANVQIPDGLVQGPITSSDDYSVKRFPHEYIANVVFLYDDHGKPANIDIVVDPPTLCIRAIWAHDKASQTHQDYINRNLSKSAYTENHQAVSPIVGVEAFFQRGYVCGIQFIHEDEQCSKLYGMQGGRSEMLREPGTDKQYKLMGIKYTQKFRSTYALGGIYSEL